jgi:hypothetical protein
MISILTSSIERELYLSRLLDSMERLGGCEEVPFEWLIVFQKSPPSQKMQDRLRSLSFANKVRWNFNEKIAPVNLIIEAFKRKAIYPLYLKLDDDALICSPDFLKRFVEISKLIPDAVIYPLEIGGYTNIQAPLSKRQVIYGEESNYFYSVGHAILPSALSVLCPMSILKNIIFTKGQSDAPLIWINCGLMNYPIFQLQNGIVVEHQECREGQYYRGQLPEPQKW